MAKPIGVKILRVYIIITNVLFLICGLLILGLGVYIHVSEAGSHVESIVQDGSCKDCSGAVRVLKMPFILMTLGGFMALMSFLGGFGAFAEVSCFLWLYALLLILLVGGEIVCGILLAVKRKPIEHCIKCSMKDQILYQYNNTNFLYGRQYISKDLNKTSLLTRAWDSIQVNMDCCGADGPHDYHMSIWRNMSKTAMKPSGKSVPPTCCVLTNTDPVQPHPKYPLKCDQEVQSSYPDTLVQSSSVHVAGCHYKFKKAYNSQKHKVILSAIAVVSFQVLAIIASCLLLGYYRRQADKYSPYGPSVSDHEMEGLKT